MPFRFKPHEPVADAVRRTARQRLEKSIDDLLVAADAGGSGQYANAIHRVRTNLKRLRALLRTIRPHLGDFIYHRENTALRDVARQLAPARDAAVLLETFDAILHATREANLEQHASAIRAALGSPADQTTPPATPCADSFLTAADRLYRVQKRVARWPLEAQGFGLIAEGLCATYRRGRSEMRIAKDRPDVAHLHEWRKQAKYLWYDVRMLQPACPDLLTTYRKSLKKLTELLGEDHDLASLDQALVALSTRSKLPLDILRCTLHTRRESLHEKIFPRGRRLYTDKPKRFTRRIGTRFNHWHRVTY